MQKLVANTYNCVSFRAARNSANCCTRSFHCKASKSSSSSSSKQQISAWTTAAVKSAVGSSDKTQEVSGGLRPGQSSHSSWLPDGHVAGHLATRDAALDQSMKSENSLEVGWRTNSRPAAELCRLYLAHVRGRRGAFVRPEIGSAQIRAKIIICL